MTASSRPKCTTRIQQLLAADRAEAQESALFNAHQFFALNATLLTISIHKVRNFSQTADAATTREEAIQALAFIKATELSLQRLRLRVNSYRNATPETKLAPPPAPAKEEKLTFPNLISPSHQSPHAELSILNGNSGRQPMSRRYKANQERAILVNHVPGSPACSPGR